MLPLRILRRKLVENSFQRLVNHIQKEYKESSLNREKLFFLLLLLFNLTIFVQSSNTRCVISVQQTNLVRCVLSLQNQQKTCYFK